MAKQYKRKKAPSPAINPEPFDFEYYKKIYTPELLKKIASDMGIETPCLKQKLEEEVLYAAGYYESHKKSAIGYAPHNEESAVLIDLSKKLNTVYNQLLKVGETGRCNFKIHESVHSLYKQQKINPDIEKMLSVFIQKNRIRSSVLHLFIKTLSEISIEASKVESFNISNSRIDCLITWIRNLDYFWNTNGESKPLTAGRWSSTDGEQKSEHVEILMDIIKPLDESVIKSEVVNALRKAIAQEKAYPYDQ